MGKFRSCRVKTGIALAMTSMALCLQCVAFLHPTFRGAKSTRTRIYSSTQTLVAEENPHADVNAKSVSGVRYSSVLSGLNKIFSPQELEKRNALSRRDGYWPFLHRGDDPPEEVTYGEFDFYFFADLLDRAHALYRESEGPSVDWSDKVFVDLGSGTGRLVLSAAALHPSWRLCRGIELLSGISNAAVENLEKCRAQGSRFALNSHNENANCQEMLHMAPIDLKCGSFDDPYVYFGDANCIFVFSSCFGNDTLDSLAKSIGRQCKPGTLVITTDYMLPLEGMIPPMESDDRVPSGSYKLRLVDKVEGWCWLTGGASTAFIHRVVESLSDRAAQSLA